MSTALTLFIDFSTLFLTSSKPSALQYSVRQVKALLSQKDMIAVATDFPVNASAAAAATAMDLCVYQSERNLVDIRAFGDAYESIREKEILWISEHL